jgi:hypothetical protein
MKGLADLFASATPSSKIESQIASLQSALDSQTANYNASTNFPLGDGTGLSAVSNIGQLSGVTISNAYINASSIPDLSGSYLSHNGGALDGNLVLNGNATTTGTSYFSGNVGIGTSTSDAFSLNGSAYLANVTPPTITANRLYSSNGTLYWAGNIIGGASTGNWASDGTNLWRTSGAVGIGTSSPFASLSVVGNGYFTGGLTSASANLGNATSTNLLVTNTLSIGTLSGFLKSINGTISTSTINLANDVSNMLPISFGGTGTSSATGAVSTLQFLQATSSALARSVQSKLAETISVKDFGAAGNTLSFSDGTISANSNAFSSNSASFTAADIGKTIWIDYAGNGTSSLQTTITGITDSHHVTLAANAQTTVPYTFLSGIKVTSAQSGSGSYAPGDTITLSGGTASVPAVVTVSRTDVMSVTLVSGGSGGTSVTGSTSGSCVVTGTTGAGERKFSANVTISGGAIASVGSIVNAGQYSANPTVLTAEPVTGCGALTGATVSLVMGVLLPVVTTQGSYTTTTFSLTQLSTSGSGTGATFSPEFFVTAGAFTYGTDDTAAWTNAMNYVTQLDNAGNLACLHAPSGAYLITAALPTFYKVPGCINGDGSNQTIIDIAPSLSGTLFSWSEDWGGVHNPVNSLPTTSGPILTNLHIVGDQDSSNTQHAITFFDRDDNVYVDNVFVDTLNGSCFRTGVPHNVPTQASIRESYIQNFHCFNSGNANSPAMDILSTDIGGGDGTNEVTFQDINIFAPYGAGFVLHSNNSAGGTAERLINVNNLRVEGFQTGIEPGNLVQVGDSGLSGNVNTVSFDQLQLITPYLGYAALDVTADTSADQPYFINASNVVMGGGNLGQGLRIEAGRNMSFSFQRIGTNDYNVFVGAFPLVGSSITFSDNGSESSLYTSIDPTSIASVKLPSGATLASLTSGTATNISFGGLSLLSATSSIDNAAFGYNALLANTSGYNNSAFGFMTLAANTTGFKNTAFGRSALAVNSTGFLNVAIGDSALGSLTTGSNNTAVGGGALAAVTTGINNTALGENAEFYNQTGSGNTAIGQATDGVGSGTSASHANNTEVGSGAGFQITTGSNNIFLGYGVASTTHIGSNNIALGYAISLPSVDASNQLDIGNIIYGTGINGTYNTISTGAIGIGTSTPGSLFSVGNTNGINFSTATSTFSSTGGINLTSGCFAINGVCITSSGGSTASTTLLFDNNTFSGNDTFNNPLSLMGTSGTTTVALGQGFSIGGSQFILQQGSGFVGIGSTSPDQLLSVAGNIDITGNSGYMKGAQTILNTFGTTTLAGIGAGSTLDTTAAGGNVAFGYQALNTATSSSDDTAIGYQALRIEIAAVNGGMHNTALGWAALSNDTYGAFNTALGAGALLGNTTGSSNVAVGLNAGVGITTGSNNVAVGLGTLAAATTGNTNTAIGYNALRNSTGSNNTALGYFAGQQLGSGANNIFLGWEAATTTTTGSNNIALGWSVDLPNIAGSNQLDVGNLIYGTGINGTYNTISTGAIGIGTTTPYSRLEVFGPDTASTSAFAVVNSASTTEFTVYDTGNAVLAGSLTQNSDERLKTNVSALDGSSSLAKINALNPVTFNWIDPDKSSVPQFGFIAQQVEQVFPNLVSTTSPTALTPDGTLSLNYIDLISPIIAAIQELDREITSLTSTVAGFAQSITSAVGNFGQINTDELCVQGTCVTGSQLQSLLAAANQPAVGGGTSSGGSAAGSPTSTAPIIQINGANPAIVQVGATYSDLGASITGPQADLNLDINTYLNGAPMNPIQIDTSAAATDTIDYVVRDTAGNASTSTRTVIIEAPIAASVPTDDASSTDDATSTEE